MPGLPPRPRYAWLAPAPGVDLAHEQPSFLARLNAVGAYLKKRLQVFSGYRSDAASAAAGGFAGDPHSRGIGADVNVDGVPIGQYPGGMAAIARAGLRSGNQAGFFRGNPDPAHVDAVNLAGGPGAPAPTATRGTPQLRALEKLWTDAGGPADAAATMAAVALAESRGNASAHNYNPSTGDDSYGLWQINYYGNLRASRVARFGPPAGLLHPAANARAAVAIYNGSGPGAWSTYKSGAYRSYLGGAAGGPGVIRARPGGGGGGGIGGFFGDVAGAVDGAAESGWKALIGVVDGPLALVKAALWLLNPRSWLRATEFVVGLGLMLLGLLGLATVFASRSPAVRKAAGAAALAPGPVGAVGKGVSALGAAGGRRRSRSSSSSSSRAPTDRELASARVETERERARAVRARSRRALEQSRETRAEREARERRAYFRGAADAGKP